MIHRFWTRGIALLLVLVLLFSLFPAVFALEESGQEPAEEYLPEETAAPEASEEAADAVPAEEEAPAELPEEEAAEESAEEPNAEPEGELPEEPSGEAAEEPAEALPEVLPEAEQESPAEVQVTFTLDSAFILAVDGGAYQSAEEAADCWELTLQLVPGCYEISLRAEGFRDGSFLLEVEAEPMTIALNPETYGCGILGMDNAYELTNEDLKAVAFMESCDYLTLLAGMVPGEDYIEDQVMFTADSEETARAVAAAYGAELYGYTGGIAILELGEELCVYDAVAACYVPENRLPAVQPVAIVSLNPVPEMETIGEVAAFNAGLTSATNRNMLVKLAEQLGLVVDEYLRSPGKNDYQYQHDMMNTYEAWGVTPAETVTVKVAVIDTGVNTSHEDLNIAGTAYYYNSINPSYKYNSTSVEDNHGHGTHCAGILGAQLFNGLGGAGIDPWVELYCYRAMNDSGYGNSATLSAGILWAVEQQVDVISMSIGSYVPTATERSAIQEAIDAGITVVVAAGNDGSNIKNYPAGYDIPGMIVVGALNKTKTRAYYSNYGSWVDVYAPGSDIISATKGDPDAYEFRSGTSMATPAVAGACALYISCLKAEGKAASPQSVEAAVKKSVTNGSLDCLKLVSKGYTAAGIQYALTADGVDYSEKFGSGSVVPSNLLLQLNCDGLGEGETIYYTLDGTEPAFLNGVPVNGIAYDGEGISFSAFQVGQRITVTAASFAANGERGELTCVTYTVGVAADLSAIRLTAPKTIEAGSETALRAEDYFGTDITEQVNWMVTLANGTYSEALTVTKDGILTANVTADSVILVSAYAPGGSLASQLITVHAVQPAAGEIAAAPPATRVDIQAMHSIGYDGGVACTYNRYGALKTITLYAADLPDYAADETCAELNPVVWCGKEIVDGKELTWSSGKPAVAEVTVAADGSVLLQAKTIGKTTITAKAEDGSKKKATVTVYVKAPASYVEVRSSHKADLKGNYYLTAGKTVSHKAVVGDTYGKPSGYRTYWSASLEWFGPGGSGSLNSDQDPGYIRISKGGTLRLYNAVKYLPHYYDEDYTWTVTVACEVWSDSYHCVSNSISYTVAPVIVRMSAGARRLDVTTGGSGYNPISMDRAGEYYQSALEGAFSVSSSNAKVCGAYYDGYGLVRVVGGERAGRAYITVKALDGSGRKCTFLVVVSKP